MLVALVLPLVLLQLVVPLLVQWRALIGTAGERSAPPWSRYPLFPDPAIVACLIGCCRLALEIDVTVVEATLIIGILSHV